MVARPIIKWAGGKSSVAQHVLNRIPEKMETYYEPLVGGGCILLKLAAEKRFNKAVISDTNPDLINAYRIIKKKVEELIAELSNGEYIYDKDEFYKIRALNSGELSPIKQAARFIYLNKTCFNGLYRVNGDGQFNTPFGRYKNPTICDESNLRALNIVLKKVKILQEDFQEVCQEVCEGDVVYFDPPYIPLSKTSSFTNYTKKGFNYLDHVRLYDEFYRISEIPARVILSNSSAPEALDLYKQFDIDYITGSRCIGGPASYRNSVKEIIAFAGPK
jgi:DNA adenine methylase